MSATTEPKKPMTKRRVEQRVRDWRRRLLGLYAQIEDWTRHMRARPSVHRGVVRQRHERMMRDFGVAPRDLPTLIVRSDDHEVEFAPSCLWILGANGRVDVTVDGSPHTLFDEGGEDGQPSDWQLMNPDPKIVLEPFTREAFLRIAGLG